MEKEVIVATKNKGKVKEFSQLLSKEGVVVKSLLDYPEIPDIIEDGQTFTENAAKKAETIAEKFNSTVIADDSGLIVDALGGKPGVFSARYAGEEKDDIANMEKVLNQLLDLPDSDRTARFYCAIAVAIPNSETRIYEGACEGYITREPRGKNGFGYDPIMYIPEKEKTMAELAADEKNKISHRSKALKALLSEREEIFRS
ncbi:XTP/dITP diphosphatase [Halalkalibacter urbisdiaboli]|uniref:XTP/dITP diphosphatase n=1 Tax=Halalkalibacter urbisdiaboli TaxID=1960589 RepID=UPI000B4527E9|nr:XTP/dITP diphosphatase [Halalkalibacter urbisdiaboli]